MKIYLVSKMWGYDGGSAPVQAFTNQSDAQAFIDKLETDDSFYYDYEEVLLT